MKSDLDLKLTGINGNGSSKVQETNKILLQKYGSKEHDSEIDFEEEPGQL
jgi:hypothetical protein